MFGRRESQTLRSAHAANADLTDRRNYLLKGAGESMGESSDSSSTREERKKERDYTYTHTRIPTTTNRSSKAVPTTTKKVFPNRFHLYIPTNLLVPFQKGLEAFKIHGQSASKNIVDFVVRFGQVHGRGNPQLLMETFVSLDAPSPMRVLCWSHLAGATSDGQVYCRKYGGIWIQGIRCYSCPDNQLRRRQQKGASEG